MIERSVWERLPEETDEGSRGKVETCRCGEGWVLYMIQNDHGARKTLSRKKYEVLKLTNFSFFQFFLCSIKLFFFPSYERIFRPGSQRGERGSCCDYSKASCSYKIFLSVIYRWRWLIANMKIIRPQDIQSKSIWPQQEKIYFRVPQKMVLLPQAN